MNEEENKIQTGVQKLDAGIAKPIVISKEEAYKLAKKKPKKIINRVVIKPKVVEEQQIAKPQTLNIQQKEMYKMVEEKNDPKKMLIYGIIIVILALIIIFWSIPLLKSAF